MLSFKNYLVELRNPADIAKFKKSVAGFDKVDTRDNSWSYDLPQLMGKYGFKTLGSGKYGFVFGNPSYPYVLKIFMKDSAYLKWIEFCKKNQSNPYIPKIRGKVVKITPMFYAIRLEKLTPYSHGGGTQFNKDYSAWKADKLYKSSDKNIQDILDYFSIHKDLLDLHGENMMMRKNQLVIIDPFYNWFGKKNPKGYTIDPDDINPNLF